MKGSFLFWTFNASGNVPCYNGILDYPEGTYFRKSYLLQGGRINHGDKGVRHWKMQGSVSPVSSELPFPWSGTNVGTYRDLTVQCQWFCGTDVSESSVRYTYTKTGKTHSYSAVRIVWNSDHTELHRYVKSREDEDWWYQYPIARKNASGIWSTYFGWRIQYNVNFVLHQPLPYYWVDYMESIRPFSPNDVSALSEVCRNTISEYTTLATNNYANLFEVIDLIKEFRNGKIIDLVESAQDWYRIIIESVKHPTKSNLRRLGKSASKEAASSWLKYRYAYNTTKSDVEQYAHAVFNNYLGSQHGDRVMRGSIGISAGELRIKMRIHDNPSPNFEYVLIGLDQYGLFPGLYTIWDMIPFSFIADWFSNLGDVFQDIDQRIYFSYYKIDELLVSKKQVLSLQEPWGLTTYTWYERNLLTEWPQWEIYQELPKSKKVITCRALDALSLVVSAT
jgi:hypothetical protein